MAYYCPASFCLSVERKPPPIPPSAGDSSQGGQGLGALYNIYEEGNNNALLQLTEGGGGALRGAGFGASQGGGFGTYTGLLAGLEEEEDLGGGSGAICR